MKAKLTYILFFSFCLSFSQQKDSLKIREKYQPDFTVGADVLNGILGFFNDRKIFQGYVSTKIKKNLHAVLDAGFEKNIYQKNGYDATAKGFYGKIGGYYMLSIDAENPDNGFYAGAKLASSFYNQEYKKVPIRGYGGSDQYLSLPSSSQSSYWLEGFIGARVQFFNSKFYVDVNAQPRFLGYTSKQEEMYPMIVPGFGKSSTKFNLGFSWNIAYQF